ncbi:hypothetical protein T12_12025, partial [Trichinella patagoniensis]
MPDHGDGHGSTNPNEEDPLKYFMLNSRIQVNHVVHSMELGFLKTTRSCCHNEICTYIFQLNHQQMSMTVCRQLEHCEQLKWSEKLGREDR